MLGPAALGMVVPSACVFSTPRDGAESNHLHHQLTQRRRGEFFQMLAIAVAHLRQPHRITEQRTADGNQVELATLHALDEFVEADRCGALAAEGRSASQ